MPNHALQAAIADPPHHGAGVDDRSGGVRILVVDDSPVYRKLLQHSLQNDGYLLSLAKNGQEALQVFAENKPEIVITDWSMPDLTGLELCRLIRQENNGHYAYLILVTSNSDKDEVIEGFKAGADDYITKPFHSGELLARVSVGRRLVDLHRQLEAKNRQLEEIALTDPLTGLPNRRAIESWATAQLSAAARHGFTVWFVMADLDHFKKINDSFGHEAGDKILQGFAELLRGNTRKSNLCGRLGGEEFVLIITHASQEQALIAVERIRKNLEDHEFSVAGKTIRVTASFGMAAALAGQVADLNDSLALADAALYVAKAAGRNRIEFAPGASLD